MVVSFRELDTDNGDTNYRPEAMLATLAMIRKEWGSAEGFFLKEAKVSPETITRVRQKLLISN
jgi:hypothetical protein